jgi:hypothetical protein
MNAERKARMQTKIASLLGNDPVLAAIHTQVTRLNAADKAISWNVERGQHRLVRVVYDARGNSTVTPVAGPFPAAAFLAHVGSMR